MQTSIEQSIEGRPLLAEHHGWRDGLVRPRRGTERREQRGTCRSVDVLDVHDILKDRIGHPAADDVQLVVSRVAMHRRAARVPIGGGSQSRIERARLDRAESDGAFEQDQRGNCTPTAWHKGCNALPRA